MKHLILPLIGVCPLVAATLHVDETVANSGDGSSWASAFQNLQEAFTVAVSGDVVLVAEGVYFPDEGPTAIDNDRLASFQLVEGVEVEGGYPNGGGVRDLSSHQTVLSGDLEQDDDDGPSGLNSYNVVLASGTTAATILDGFLISGGLADDDSVDDFERERSGGGLFSSGGSPTIINCSFRANVGGFGGACFLTGSSPTFINCLFSGNLATVFGGALNLRNGASPSLTNCTLSGNAAASFGGGGAISSFSAGASLSNCIIWNNSANNDTSSSEASINNTSGITFFRTLVQNIDLEGMNPNGEEPGNNPDFLSPLFPLLAPSLAGDFRLISGSPVIDNGDNSLNSQTIDLEGAVRIQDTTIDLGALEGGFERPFPEVLHVDTSVASPGDGSSWSNAFSTLQDALAATEGEQTIRVAAGTYYPDQGGDTVTGDRNASFVLKPFIRIEGGYPVGGGARDLANAPTILSGDLDCDDVDAPTGNNSYSVVTARLLDSSSVLDGFIVSGGLADDDSVDFLEPQEAGGGIHCNTASPQFIRCWIRGNSAVFGGGILNNEDSSPTFINCAFTGNFASGFGGGFNNRNFSSPKIVNCTLSGNAAQSGGGAITNFDQSNPEIVNSIIWGNSAANNTTSESASVNGAGATMFAFSLVQNFNLGGTNLDGLDASNNPSFLSLLAPLSAPSQSGDFRLEIDSPALDVGDNNASVLARDLLGATRVQNDEVDLGAFEGAFDSVVFDVLHVDASVASSGDGSSWAMAFDDLQDALITATGEQTILVAGGTYYPDQGGNEVAGDREASFILRSTITIEGGYPPGGGARDLASHPTILSGDLDQNDLSGPAGNNSFTIVRAAQADASAVLDGFILSGGLADDDSVEFFEPQEAGGAIHCQNAFPIFQNCWIRGNFAVFGGGVAHFSSSPRYVNCIFSGNSAEAFGGGMNNRSGSSPELINCTLTGNLAMSDGGAITNFSSSNPSLANCIVWNNSANGIGLAVEASVHDNGSTTTFSHCLVQNINPGGSSLDGTNPFNDPFFVEGGGPSEVPSNQGNFQLVDGSSALNVGDNNVSPLEQDLFGNSRILDTTIDLGAIEGGFEILDSDGDGLPDIFEMAHTDPPSAIALDPDSDEDQDSLTAFEELAYNLDPNTPNGSPIRKTVTEVDGVEYLSITASINFLALPFFNLTAERSFTLLSDSWDESDLVPLSLELPDTGFRSNLPLGSEEREFLRLRVSPVE